MNDWTGCVFRRGELHHYSATETLYVVVRGWCSRVVDGISLCIWNATSYDGDDMELYSSGDGNPLFFTSHTVLGAAVKGPVSYYIVTVLEHFT